MYIPDNWIIMKINTDDPCYKLLTGWSGSYIHGSNWRINSGIINVELIEDSYIFHGYTKSMYKCHKDAYGLRSNNGYIWNKLKELHGEKITMMDEKTNWLEIDWVLKEK